MSWKHLLGALMISTSTVAHASVDIQNSNYCLSTYHLQQQLRLTVDFGEIRNVNNSKIDVDIHVREVKTPGNNVIERGNTRRDGETVELRSYLVMIKPNGGTSNGLEIDQSDRYRHPFLVTVNRHTGEILDLSSTERDPKVLKEFWSFFDLFQYTEKEGGYRYRNGNGQYSVKITRDKELNSPLVKSNQGYLKTDDSGKESIKVLKSKTYISMEPGEHCFYKDAIGIEEFETNLSSQGAVGGFAEMIIASDNNRILKPSDDFYTLTTDLATWPTFEKTISITQEEAFKRIPFLLTQLSALTKDKNTFLSTMLGEKDVWGYLADYILQYGIDDDLSLELFWALDRIDSTESVNALAKLATSPLSDRDQFRAAVALGSTKAALSRDSIDLLQGHVLKLANPSFESPERLAYVRMIGSVADRRYQNSPAQSVQLRQFLYSQVDRYGESVNAAVLDAIGNLKDSIDDEGREILMKALSADSEHIRFSASAAYGRVSYDSEYSRQFIGLLSTEQNNNIKNRLVEVLGKASNNDVDVKRTLLSLVDDPSVETSTLNSLKKIDYSYQDHEINVLEQKLKRETDKTNQKLLASLILKHRRR